MSGALERFLIARGERIVRVAPKHMAGARRSSRERGKSDSIDAFSVARAALKEGIDEAPRRAPGRRGARHPLAGRPSRGSRRRSRPAINSGCAGICTTSGPSSRSRPARSTPPSGSGRVSRRLARAEQTTRVRIARELVRQITASTKRIRELEAELAALVESYAPQLLAERGCGPLTAAKLIGEIAGADRFATDAKLARTGGSAPIPASSGNTHRHRLDRGGNRQLNCALHRLAVNKANWDPDTAAYLARKQAEGKSRKEALRCLKRHLARRVWQLLRAPAPGQDPRSNNDTNLNNPTSPHHRQRPHFMACTR